MTYFSTGKRSEKLNNLIDTMRVSVDRERIKAQAGRLRMRRLIEKMRRERVD